MSSPPGGWSSLKVTGEAPPPCSSFTLTAVGENRAAMYGGDDGWNTFNQLCIVELGRHSVVSVITRSVYVLVLYMHGMLCTVSSHHFLFLEYMISLFLSPALEQHQYIY